MDFSLSPDLQELQQRTRRFIRERILPLEDACYQFAPPDDRLVGCLSHGQLFLHCSGREQTPRLFYP